MAPGRGASRPYVSLRRWAWAGAIADGDSSQRCIDSLNSPASKVSLRAVLASVYAAGRSVSNTRPLFGSVPPRPRRIAGLECVGLGNALHPPHVDEIFLAGERCSIPVRRVVTDPIRFWLIWRRRRRLNAAHLLPLVRAGVVFIDGVQQEPNTEEDRKEAA